MSMFWCPTCKCAYPHGPEGPATALEEHIEVQHAERDSSATRVPEITGKQVLIGLVAMATLAWVLRIFGIGE